MPSDTLSLTVGTGLGVSVLAGIISGVCFVMGYRRIHRKRETKWHCAVCNKYFRSPEFILGEAGFVICNKCNKKVCKSTCSSLYPNSLWVCQVCSEPSNNWICGAFKAVEPITKVFFENMGLDQELPNEIENDQKVGEETKKEQVRTFIERLVNNLLGDNIDDASINEIYSDKKYLPVVGESPCSAHTALKRIIQKIIREANDLPKLKNIDQCDSSNQENRTYEDLLSTAILNKIISSSQNSISLNSSRANSVCSHRSSSLRRRKLHNKDYIFGEESLHNKKKWRHDTDTASVSSLEEWVHSDSSRGSTKYVDRVSLTIKQRIEEVSSSESEAEVDYDGNIDVEYGNFKSTLEDAEPNWFLQKRQFRGISCSPVPVSMLVPDSTKEAKVLIGDKEIDDTSDLSDVPSDFEDENSRLPSLDVKNHLIDSKNLIGGKNSIADFYSSNFSDDEVSGDSGVKECKCMDEVDSELMSTSNKNDIVTDASISSDGSNTERDTEYTEKYGTLPRKISISPKEDELAETPTSDDTNEGISGHKNDTKAEMENENISNFTGVYSRREKEKWSHAVELENNPYSKENIEKRIKCRNSVNSLFGSDYYIRHASLPSGTKKTEEKIPCFSEEADTFQSEEHTVNRTMNVVEHIAPVRIEREKLVLMARPFNISESPKQNAQPESLNNLEKTNKDHDEGLHFASELSSDSELSLVNCYDVKESVIYKKLSTENNEEIQSAEKYFDFESLEASLNPEEEKEQEKVQLEVEAIHEGTPDEKSKTFGSKNKLELIKHVENKYETEEHSVVATPYVITKRSDNTLIKKIYSDPSVRSFALSNRKTLPSTVKVTDFERKPATATNYDTSSEVFKQPMLMKKQWEDRKASEKTSKETKYVQSSSLVEEHFSKQISQVEKQPSPIYNKETEIKSSVSIEDISKLKKGYEGEINLNNQQAELTVNNTTSNKDKEACKEIDKLKKQKLVANRIKEFSKSTLDLSSSDIKLNKEINRINTDEDLYFRIEHAEEGFSRLQNIERSSSVRDIRKKFETFDADAKVEHPILHSLTGRSISKQFKEKLRNFNGDIPTLSQIHSLSLTNLEVEENAR